MSNEHASNSITATGAEGVDSVGINAFSLSLGLSTLDRYWWCIHDEKCYSLCHMLQSTYMR